MTYAGPYAKKINRPTIRKIASNMRSICGLNKPYINMEELIDFILPRVWPDFYYTVEEVEDMGENLGLASPEKASFALRRDVWDAMRRGCPTHRFIVMHELGHLILHKPSRITYPKRLVRVSPVNDPEWQADTFAAELLANHSFVDMCPRGARDLAPLTGVPIEMALKQWDHYQQEGLVKK